VRIPVVPNGLAPSLQQCPRMATVPALRFEPPAVGCAPRRIGWDILLDSHHPRELLSLLQAFLHLRLRLGTNERDGADGEWLA